MIKPKSVIRSEVKFVRNWPLCSRCSRLEWFGKLQAFSWFQLVWVSYTLEISKVGNYKVDNYKVYPVKDRSKFISLKLQERLETLFRFATRCIPQCLLNATAKPKPKCTSGHFESSRKLTWIQTRTIIRWTKRLIMEAMKFMDYSCYSIAWTFQMLHFFIDQPWHFETRQPFDDRIQTFRTRRTISIFEFVLI